MPYVIKLIDVINCLVRLLVIRRQVHNKSQRKISRRLFYSYPLKFAKAIIKRLCRIRMQQRIPETIIAGEFYKFILSAFEVCFEQI
ncbi:MAG: hypothetical protein MJZ03_06905, partial [archaeon]|nr:hypothetical protein [archaeon]